MELISWMFSPPEIIQNDLWRPIGSSLPFLLCSRSSATTQPPCSVCLCSKVGKFRKLPANCSYQPSCPSTAASTHSTTPWPGPTSLLVQEHMLQPQLDSTMGHGSNSTSSVITSSGVIQGQTGSLSSGLVQNVPLGGIMGISHVTTCTMGQMTLATGNAQPRLLYRVAGESVPGVPVHSTSSTTTAAVGVSRTRREMQRLNTDN